MQRFDFPADFLWGAATAAYQVEGAAAEDGKADSIWDVFCRRPGSIRDGSSGAVACDHYHRLEQDLDLMQGLGLKGYRFSISWPRVQPLGVGPANAPGLDFYERLVDGLLKRGITPNATLYHWDLPQALEQQGGWPSRDIAQRFGDYAALVAKRLGDRVGIWATFNEPNVFVHCGYQLGVFAPGRQEGARMVRQCIHHVLLAHGLATQALRAHAKPGAQLGIVLAPALAWPDRETPAHYAAAEACWAEENDWWVQPMLHGRYPEAVLRRLTGCGEAPQVQRGDLDVIRQPLDYLGVNGYFPARVEPDMSGDRGYRRLPFSARNEPLTSFGWEVYAPAYRAMLVQFHRRYGLPLHLTENGISIATDAPGPDGAVHDERRIDYLQKHLAAAHQARAAGADIRGYFHWSLMDNFEWSSGYTQRFGLIHVDYATLKRTPKDSARWYRGVIAQGGFSAAVPEVISGWEKRGAPASEKSAAG
jgi:beta-glucosidase